MEGLKRRSRAYWARLRGYLAGRRVVQVKDLAIEAGLGHDYYGDSIFMELHHAEKLLRLGYRPVVVPAMSGKLGVLVLVREPWKLDATMAPVHPRLLPYLEDGDPLMALHVGRVQQELEAGHGRA